MEDPFHGTGDLFHAAEDPFRAKNIPADVRRIPEGLRGVIGRNDTSHPRGSLFDDDVDSAVAIPIPEESIRQGNMVKVESPPQPVVSFK